MGGAGGINPVNFAAISPAADGESVAITALNFPRLIPIDQRDAVGEQIVESRIERVIVGIEDGYRESDSPPLT
jgi:hypothetical protein